MLIDYLVQNGAIVDLTNATVNIAIQHPDTTVTTAAATATDAAAGEVSFALSPTDVSVVGRYHYEWHVAASGTTIVLPESGMRPMRVVDDLL